jgi:hypothetical protein
MARPAVDPIRAALDSATKLRALATELEASARRGEVSAITVAAKDTEAVGCRLRRASVKAGG